MNCRNCYLTKVLEPYSFINLISDSHLETHSTQLDKIKYKANDVNLYNKKNVIKKSPFHIKFLEKGQIDHFNTQNKKEIIKSNQKLMNYESRNSEIYIGGNIYNTSNILTNIESENQNSDITKKNNNNIFISLKTTKINTLGNGEEKYNQYTTNYRNKLVSPLKNKINKEQIDSIESGIKYESKLSFIEKSKIKYNLKSQNIYKNKQNLKIRNILKQINTIKNNNNHLIDQRLKKELSLNQILRNKKDIKNINNITKHSNKSIIRTQLSDISTNKKLDNINSKPMLRSYNFRINNDKNKSKNKNSKHSDLKIPWKIKRIKKNFVIINKNEIFKRNKFYIKNSFVSKKKNKINELSNITVHIEEKESIKRESKRLYMSSANIANICNLRLKKTKIIKPISIVNFLNSYKINIKKG